MTQKKFKMDWKTFCNMANYKEHCMDCLMELGNNWSVVHIWLDEYYKTWGPNHRSIRHHQKGIDEVRRKWGDEAAKAAEIHIKRDFFGKVPKDEHEVELIMDGVIELPAPPVDTRIYTELPKPPLNDETGVKS